MYYTYDSPKLHKFLFIEYIQDCDYTEINTLEENSDFIINEIDKITFDID